MSTLWVVLALLTAGQAHAMGKAPVGTEMPIDAIAESSLGVFLASGSEVIKPSQLGCYLLFFGEGMTQCIRACDDSRSRKALAVTTEKLPYAQVFELFDRFRLNGTLQHPFNQIDGLKLEKYVGKTTRYAIADRGIDDASCRVPFARTGEACLQGVAQHLPIQRFIEGGYAVLLESIAIDLSRNPGGSDLSYRLTELARQANRLRGLLTKAGLMDFQRSGHFYAQNAKNAPAMICELRSLPSPLSASVEQALSENEAELKRSIDFLERY